MFRRTRKTLVLVAALLGAIPVPVKQPEGRHVAVTNAAMLPAALWWIYGGIAYTTALGWYIISEMTCGDCAFRGRGAGGDF